MAATSEAVRSHGTVLDEFRDWSTGRFVLVSLEATSLFKMVSFVTAVGAQKTP